MKTFGARSLGDYEIGAVDVLTAQEDGYAATPDPLVLRRATSLGRVLFTHDDDLLTEGCRLQEIGEHFGGVIFARQMSLSIGETIEELLVAATVGEPADFENQVVYLPI